MSPDCLHINGGGLWGGLLAYRLHQLHPELDFKLYEKGPSFGGNHTWSFNESDVSTEAIEWLRPFITHRWDGYSVIFPKYKRDFSSKYYSISSERFHEVLQKTLPEEKKALNTICPENQCLDATGLYSFNDQHVGYQKFVGLQLKLKSKHNIEQPILMDSSVAQIDGFRFIYYLPFSETEILIEDTRYSDNVSLDEVQIKRDLEKIIYQKGWEIQSLIRVEKGALPLPFYSLNQENDPTPTLAGIFHDVTGYSLPDAVRLIDQIVEKKEISLKNLQNIILDYRNERTPDRKYFQLLNRLMFQAAEPEQRYKVLQHFYKLPQPLIERFYQGELRNQDRFRILMGTPPVPVMKAIKTILTTSNRWSR